MAIKTSTDIAHAFVFADANGNFIPDAGEATTTTDATGHFTLTGGSGTIVLSGGIDLFTGLPIVGILDAPAGASVVSRLTTILDVVADVNHVSASVANAEIVSALGFAAGTDLTTFDSEAGAAAGDANATKILAYESDSTNSAVLIEAAGGNVARNAAETDATTYYTATNRADVLPVAKLAIDSGVGSAAANVIDTIVNDADTLTYLVAVSGAPASEIVASIAAIAKVVRGAAATSLAEAGTNATALAAVLSAYTGNNLVALANAAGGTLSAAFGTVDVAGAAVFQDANGNFFYDPGEAITTSDSSGNFTLSGGSGPIVVAGGTDILTGLPLEGILYAPAGSTVVSRLTTILEVVAEENDVSASVANAEVVAALGLAAGTDLTKLNAEAGAATGDPSATRALAYETDSSDIVMLVSAAGGSIITPAALADTASNYSSATTFQTPGIGIALVTKFALDSGVGGADAAAIGQIRAAAIALIRGVAASGAPPAQVTASIAAVAKVIQGQAAAALAAAGSNATALATVLALYTGNNLAVLANAAGGTFPLAPTLTAEATAGSTFNGVAAPGATVALFEGLVQIGTAVADSITGAFSFADVPLGEGEQTLTARVKNAAGLVSLPSSSLLVAVGTSATIVGELDALEGMTALAAIDVTDTHVLHVASAAAVQALIAHDAHALSAIQGGYSFSVTTSGSGANPVVSVNYDATGKQVSSTSAYYTNGLLTRSVTVNADRSKDTYLYNVKGEGYASEHDQSNPAGMITLAERDYANGSIDSIFKAAPDGSSSFEVYDANENVMYQGFTYVDGSSSFQTYDVHHKVAEQSVTKVDQTRTVDKFTATGQIFEHDVFAASGQLSLVGLTGTDGSHTTFDYTGGQTLAATSPIRNSFVQTGAGGDTFVFKSPFGNDAITGFHAGNGTNHDVLQFNTSIIPNYQALAALMVSVDNGADTVIKVDANNSVFLHNVTVASLKQADFSFSHSA